MRSISSIIALAALAGLVAGCAQEAYSPRYGYSQATYYPSSYSYPTSYYPSGYYPSSNSYPTSYGYRSTAYEYRNYNGIHPGPETWP
jgi:hypothetical protein